MRMRKSLSGEAALAWFEAEGMSKRELRFLRRAVAGGAELSVEVFEGSDGVPCGCGDMGESTPFEKTPPPSDKAGALKVAHNQS